MTLRHLIQPAGWLVALLAAAPMAGAAEPFAAREICACYVTGLSEDGAAATGQLLSGETFRWTSRGGLELLGRNPYQAAGPSALLYHRPAISGDGLRVAATMRGRGAEVATQGVWSQPFGWQSPRQLPPDAQAIEGVVSVVGGLSRDGTVVVGHYVRGTDAGGREHASSWTAGRGVQDLGSSGQDSRVHAANADGRVLVGVDVNPSALYDRAAVWVDGVRSWLGGSRPSQARAVNAAGDVIVGTETDNTGNYAAAVWRWSGTDWSMRSLGHLPGSTGYALATGVSDDARTIVGKAARYDSIIVADNQTGFVWTEETGLVEAHDFFEGVGLGADRHYRIYSVEAISADGRVMAVVAKHRDDFGPQFRSFLVRRIVR